ncbi:MAG: efflux RND transporter permease subunit, partial [Proteobacteria bacterium]|nr:efflux RND transporter permease subunit [Pseudomonadota bacterium]
MIGRILSFSVRMRWLVAFLTLVVIGFGLWQITKLPIDAVPDVTNRQVQISTFAPTLGPVDIEKQVTFPVETALAGIPGLEMTRSISRNGFSQVTAVFTDRTDIYFARQLINSRLQEVKEQLPFGIQPIMGPIATGLGEIFLWSLEWEEGHPA